MKASLCLETSVYIYLLTQRLIPKESSATPPRKSQSSHVLIQGSIGPRKFLLRPLDSLKMMTLRCIETLVQQCLLTQHCVPEERNFQNSKGFIVPSHRQTLNCIHPPRRWRQFLSLKRRNKPIILPDVRTRKIIFLIDDFIDNLIENLSVVLQRKQRDVRDDFPCMRFFFSLYARNTRHTFTTRFSWVAVSCCTF